MSRYFHEIYLNIILPLTQISQMLSSLEVTDCRLLMYVICSAHFIILGSIPLEISGEEPLIYSYILIMQFYLTSAILKYLK
jgi:hypothetical protein